MGRCWLRNDPSGGCTLVPMGEVRIVQYPNMCISLTIHFRGVSNLFPLGAFVYLTLATLEVLTLPHLRKLYHLANYAGTSGAGRVVQLSQESVCYSGVANIE